MKKKFLLLAMATMAAATLAGCGGNTLNLNKYVDVNVVGYDGYGEVEVVWDEESLQKDFEDLEYLTSGMRLFYGSPIRYITDYCVDYDIDKDEGLKNGDKVTLKWDCDEAAISEDVDVKIKYSDITVTVKDLDEAPTFDAFAYIDLQYSGVSPSGSVRVENLAPEGSEAAKLSYSVNKSNGLKNGDIITVSVRNGDNADYMISTVGAVPVKQSMDFVVKGLDGYAGSLAEITPEMYDKMDKQARDVFAAHVANDWEDPKNNYKGIEFVGIYFLTPKDPTAWGVSQNYMTYVYKITAVDHSDKGGEFDFYWYCSFGDIMTLADGTQSVKLTDPDVPEGGYSWGSLYGEAFLHGGWWYVGYPSLDELFHEQVAKYVADYSYESTVK